MQSQQLMEKKSSKAALEVNWDVPMRELRERVIFLAEELAPSRGKYDYLEKATGISAARWQNLFLRRLMPSADMILAVLTAPNHKYITWLITGYKDEGYAKIHQAYQQESPDQTRWQKFVKMQELLAKKQNKDHE